MSSSPTAGNGWRELSSPPATLARLLCFPYAGGRAEAFRTWPEGLPPHAAVAALQLPGRGDRFEEEPLEGALEVVDEALAAIPTGSPLVLFGHSMGAIVAFEVAREIRRRNGRLPSVLVVSGQDAPQLIEPPPDPVHALSEDDFVAELARLDGTPPELLADRSLMKLVGPAIRADFAVSERYAYRAEPALELDILALSGWDDRETTIDRVDAWREQTEGSFRHLTVPGEHFFLHTSEPVVLQVLSRILDEVIIDSPVSITGGSS